MYKHQQPSRGFTLIELLVTIAIVGILSSAITASLSSARYKANDSKRRSDLKSLQSALELYYTTNHIYPSTGGAWYGVASPASVQSANNWIPGLVASGAISALPQDPEYPRSGIDAQPGCSAWPGMYIYASTDGSGYKILDHCAANSSVSTNYTSADALYDPNRPSWAWQVCSGTDCGL